MLIQEDAGINCPFTFRVRKIFPGLYDTAEDVLTDQCVVKGGGVISLPGVSRCAVPVSDSVFSGIRDTRCD